MYNEDYFKMMESKSFDEKLIAFYDSIMSMTRCEYEHCYGPPGSREYYGKEYKGQEERVNWLFENLKQTYKEENKHARKN